MKEKMKENKKEGKQMNCELLFISGIPVKSAENVPNIMTNLSANVTPSIGRRFSIGQPLWIEEIPRE